MKQYTINPSSSKPLHILLADDDHDDRHFFNRALTSLPFHIDFKTIDDGEKLMKYLIEHSDSLPNILFLDHNMPRKNGSECLSEIKQNPKLKHLAVIMYSTNLHEDIADIFYENSAHFYIRKTNLTELKKILSAVITIMTGKKIVRPSREQFILSHIEV